MIKSLLLSFCMVFSVCLSFSQNPVAENGQLQVIGHQLCNEQGKPLQLRGMCMFGLMHMPECVTWQSFKLLKEEWKANVIRVPVYMANYSNQNNYNQNPEWNNALIDSTIKWSERLGIYCIIDWHNDRYGSPNDSNHKKADVFFKQMSAKYAGKKNVIYELINEPYGETITWDTIAAYANRIMPIIRKNDPKAIILVGCPVWDQKLESIDTKKLNDTRNVMYTFHFYANSHQSLYPMFASQIHRIPVFVSEWGTCESSGMGNLDLETSSKFLNTMKQHVLGNDTVTISWCNFSYGDKAESTSALKPLSCASGLWDNTTPGGDFIKYWIKYNAAPENFSSVYRISGQTWKDHLVNDLAPYWTMPSALGEPVGNFPTYRCNDGSLNHCAELDISKMDAWIIDQTGNLQREFIRTRSRQTFFYGVAYHITGNEKYLYYAKCGVDFIHRQIHQSGLIYSWSKDLGKIKEFGPDSLHITTQDLAGALTGLSFYYYLTHDKYVLKDILKVKEYVFRNYKEKDGYLKATLCPDSTCTENRTDLASYLEQVNDYLLLITPLIEDKPASDACIAELRGFCKSMQSPVFYNPENSMIWARTKYKSLIGTGYDDPLRKIGAAGHTDYGQTARTYWNLYLIGKLLKDQSLCDFAFQNGTKIVNAAILPDGAWSLSPIESDKRSWWLHAELDEATALFSLVDPNLDSKIAQKSNTFWFNHFVDKHNHEVFPELNTKNELGKMPKIYHWKNGFHTGEHALFGYIASSSLNNQDVELYFAFNKKSTPQAKTAKPFYFNGDITKITSTDWQQKSVLGSVFTSSHNKEKVVFRNIKPGKSME